MDSDDTEYSVSCRCQYNHQCITIQEDWQVEYLQFDPTNQSHVIIYTSRA